MTLSDKIKFLVIMIVMGFVFRMGYNTGYDRAVRNITTQQLEELNHGLQDLGRQLDSGEPRNMGKGPFREAPTRIRYPSFRQSRPQVIS